MNNFLIEYYYLIIVTCTVLSLFFIQKNMGFNALMNDPNVAQLSSVLGTKKMNPQLFSWNNIPIGFLDKKRWELWHRKIAETMPVQRYRNIFILDFIWAAILLLAFYALALRFGDLANLPVNFTYILILTYFFDAIENLIYLRILDGLHSWLPIISFVKVMLYLIGLICWIVVVFYYEPIWVE